MRAVILAALVCAASLASSHSADACGAFFRAPHAPNGNGNDIELAEELIARGEIHRAARQMDRTFAMEDLNDERLGRRALRVLARIAIRSVPDPASPDYVLQSNEARIVWAVETLAMLARKDADPAVLSDLGEALALLPDQRDVALYILDTLAERDLVASPEAYAALSRLRGRAGRWDEAAFAFQRCRVMAVRPESTCGRELPVV